MLLQTNKKTNRIKTCDIERCLPEWATIVKQVNNVLRRSILEFKRENRLLRLGKQMVLW